jgi:hypothetical protein
VTTPPASTFDAVAVATVTVGLIAPALAEQADINGPAPNADATRSPEDGLIAWLLRTLTGRAHQSLQEFMSHPDSNALELAFREDLVTHLRQQPELVPPLADLLPSELLGEISQAPPIEGDGAIGRLTRKQ